MKMKTESAGLMLACTPALLAFRIVLVTARVDGMSDCVGRLLSSRHDSLCDASI